MVSSSSVLTTAMRLIVGLNYLRVIGLMKEDMSVVTNFILLDDLLCCRQNLADS